MFSLLSELCESPPEFSGFSWASVGNSGGACFGEESELVLPCVTSSSPFCVCGIEPEIESLDCVV